MAIDLAGRSIVITGGGTGIGAATARACAEAGMSIVVSGRRPEPLQSVVAMIERAGGQARGVPLDVTDPGHAALLLDVAKECYGEPWAVFANAGHGLDRPAHRMTDEEHRGIFEINYFATHVLLAEAARRMIDHARGGHLLACSSCVSKFAPPYHAAYSATKAAQDMLCQAMRMELKPAGIHVSSVHPIATMTDFFDTSASISDRESAPRGIEQSPRFFRQPPERIGKAVVKCLRRPRPEVWTSRIVRYTLMMRQAIPRLMDRNLRGMLESDRL